MILVNSPGSWDSRGNNFHIYLAGNSMVDVQQKNYY